MKHPYRVAALALATLPISGCVPSFYEASAAVLLASPVVVLLVGLLLAGLCRLWRVRHPEMRTPWRLLTTVALGALLFGLLGLALEGGQDQTLEWVGVALIFYGATFLGLFFLAWRVAFKFEPGRAAERATLVTSALLLTPALGGLIASGRLPDAMIALWVVPGLYGLLPLVMLLVVFIEAGLRRRSGRPVEAVATREDSKVTRAPDYFGPS
jgi:hypothetical protein